MATLCCMLIGLTVDQRWINIDSTSRALNQHRFDIDRLIINGLAGKPAYSRHVYSLYCYCHCRPRIRLDSLPALRSLPWLANSLTDYVLWLYVFVYHDVPWALGRCVPYLYVALYLYLYDRIYLYVYLYVNHKVGFLFLHICISSNSAGIKNKPLNWAYTEDRSRVLRIDSSI